MLKVGSKRRKTRAELDEQRTFESQSKQREVDMQKQNLALQGQLAAAREQAETNQGANDLLNQFAQQGYIRQNANGAWEMIAERLNSSFEQAEVKRSGKGGKGK